MESRASVDKLFAMLIQIVDSQSIGLFQSDLENESAVVKLHVLRTKMYYESVASGLAIQLLIKALKSLVYEDHQTVGYIYYETLLATAVFTSLNWITLERTILEVILSTDSFIVAMFFIDCLGNIILEGNISLWS